MLTVNERPSGFASSNLAPATLSESAKDGDPRPTSGTVSCTEKKQGSVGERLSDVDRENWDSNE